MGIGNDSRGIDNKHAPTREPKRANSSIEGRNGLVGVCQQWKAKTMLRQELFVTSEVLSGHS
jgi:hypothetical protein